MDGKKYSFAKDEAKNAGMNCSLPSFLAAWLRRPCVRAACLLRSLNAAVRVTALWLLWALLACLPHAHKHEFYVSVIGMPVATGSVKNSPLTPHTSHIPHALVMVADLRRQPLTSTFTPPSKSH